MRESMNTISKIIEAEIYIAEKKVRDELNKKIQFLEKENSSMKDKLKCANDIKKTNDDFFNLKDFCRVQKDFLFIDNTGMKQFLFQRGVLKKENEKYVPNDNQRVAKEICGEIYISYNYLRSILAMRSLVMLGDEDDIIKFVRKYTDNKDLVSEQLSSTVVIEYKQTSHEFRNCKGNTYIECLGGK